MVPSPPSDEPRPAPWFVLPTPAGESILAEFNAAHVTSDGGRLWLAQADEHLQLGAILAACIPEWRRGPVRHGLATLVRQRPFQSACGAAEPLAQLIARQSHQQARAPLAQAGHGRSARKDEGLPRQIARKDEGLQ